ncbi:type II secretion system minor pseudopilin GspH [Pseudomonas sp. JQ36]
MRQRCRGFTLLELMVVMLLIGMLLGMVSLVGGNNPAQVARQEASRIARMIEQFRERAVLEGREFGVGFSLEGYRVLQLDAQGWQPLTALQQWPADLHAQLVLDGLPVRLLNSAPAPQLLMLSSDEISAFSLLLASRERVWAGLASDGLSEVTLDE